MHSPSGNRNTIINFHVFNLCANEMQNMRQQLEYLQAELNKELSRELHEYHSRRAVVEPRETDAEDGSCFVKRDGLKRGLQSMDASGYPMGEAMTGENYMEIDEAVAKEWEHALLRTTMGKEFNELNKRLEQKEVLMVAILLGFSEFTSLRKWSSSALLIRLCY
ncbi:kinesin-like protein KIN-4A isoform X2 [Camellia sinensis]|uniref:kinesin-like protein KIN-4A isoform X2 n=1 Tax=Camellia sinensis TaxID=4442 RepID=UPI001035F46C|nr:kinesin-like protein KIN-4A isoform X2 [Camellia sinensis]